MKNPSSLPKEFAQRMQISLDTEFNQFESALQTSSPISIRANPRKNNIDLSSNTPIPWCQYGYYLTNRPLFTLDPSLHAGAYYVQEASSMLIEQALLQSVDVKQSLRVLDLCAAPGGKSTHLLSLLNEESLLVSNEAIRSRAFILSENIQKWGNTNVVVTNNDPNDFHTLDGYFDVVLVDAPCSGEGLFRKDANAMEEWSVENTSLCSLRQKRILTDVFPSLKENGILIYSTCTYNDEENENNLIWLNEQNDWEFLTLQLNPEWGIEETNKGIAIGYRCYPHKVRGEGFFISVLRKKSISKESNLRARRKFELPSKKINELLNNWISSTIPYQLIQQENRVIALPENVSSEIQWLAERLTIITKGTALADLKHDKAVPDHAFALSHFINKNIFLAHSVDLKEALLYLKKEPFPIEQVEKGFALITYNNNTLGWVNLIGNRFNNLYPVNWRIRMAIE